MRVLAFFASGLIAATANAVSPSPTVDLATAERLISLPVGSSLVIDDVPDGFGGRSNVSFRRIDVYTSGARTRVIDADREYVLPRSTRREWIGATVDGSVRVSLGIDENGKHVSGVGTSSAGTFVISGERAQDGLMLRAVPVESTYPPGIVPRISGEDDGLPSGNPQPSALAVALSGQRPEGTLRGAVVAVDTDNEFMSERFGGDTGAARDWIADLVATMNVMYEHDLNVELLLGDTILRTSTDPYSAHETPASSADLDEFGSYWQAHYGSIQRSFAMLLSGKSSNGNSASGIAWINSYCETQSQGGSYSVNQIFTNPAVNISLSALIVGHELGHNLGAYHTHCTNVANGNAPTGTNTIDQCWNGEANSGCYSGPTSCPSTGPGAPAGTIMSYCNQLSCGPMGQNVAQFHPTQIATLSALIAGNTPSCLSPDANIIFRNGFD